MLPLVVGYTANFLATPIALNQLGLHNFGIWAITGALAQYAGLFDLGVSRAAYRYVAIYHASGDTKSQGSVVSICGIALLLLGTALTGIILIVPVPFERLLGMNDPRAAKFLLLAAVLVLIVGLLARLLAAAAVGRGRFAASALGVSLLSAMQSIGGVAALFLLSNTLMSFAAGTVAGSVLGLVAVIAIILFDERRLNFSKPLYGLAKEILAYGIASQIAAAGDLLLLQSGKIIAGVFISPSAAALFDLASRLTMGAQSFGSASAAALVPHLTRNIVSEGVEFVWRTYEHLTRKNCAVAIYVSFAIASTSFSLIPLWLGHEQEDVLLVLGALLPGIAVNVSTGVCTSAISALGRPGILAGVTAVAGVFQVALTSILAYTDGLHGIMIGFLIGVPIAKLAGLFYMQRKVSLPAVLYVRGVRGPYGVAAIAMACSIWIGVVFEPHDRTHAIMPFLASGIIFTVLYLWGGLKFKYLPTIGR
jgi:O-antigen/teichoic acid export membrane protein